MKPTQDDMERAARIDIGRCACSYHYLCGVHTLIAQAIADACDSTGLLVTPLHERALKACEDLVNDFDWSVNGRLAECCAIGRESLAEKKARGPVSYARGWMTVGPINGGWQVIPPQGGAISISATLTEPQARAVAAALNALEVAK